MRLWGGPRDGLVQGRAIGGSALGGARLSFEGSPRRGKPANRLRRGAVWRLTFQDGPATIPSKTAKN